MSYSQFTLETVEQAFGLSIIEKLDLFTNVPEASISDFLKQSLEYNTPLALEIATEKARSEMIIAPILIELKKQFNSHEQYLEWESQQEIRHEYVDGEILAMTGGTIPHNDITLFFIGTNPDVLAVPSKSLSLTLAALH
ncbi:Uma2 family endonuclease [Floridanema aerugineum]|uniref:Uma2 family endonuclease n=1 Tax=Floridaenema aerugineum BLCC-F46 TaxID=3153654 RepID=A0ABV4XI14_9CYAN